jgi:low affinity Fe/Cu permease
MNAKGSTVGHRFERFAHAISRSAGSTTAFVGAVGLVLIWGISGPLFHYSNTWQLVINTGTTVVTFLMVFLIQRTQNKEALAVQLKLNELVAAMQGASNRMVNVEDLDEADLEVLHNHYRSLAEMAKREGDIRQSHSLDEADERHRSKMGGRKSPPVQ